MPLLSADDVAIHYEFDSRPDRSVLVLSNSLGTNLSLWDGQAPEFARHFSLLRYDNRGHGRSTVPGGPYSIEQLGRDVLWLLDELKLRRVHFCGLSMGGMVGQWLGTHAPDRLKSLVLASTGAQCGDETFWNERIELARRHGMEFMIPSILGGWYSADFSAAYPTEIERTSAMLRETAAEGFAACCAAIRDMDQRAEVANIHVPSLVVFGRNDLAIPPGVAKFLIENIPGAESLELNAAHLSNVEAADAFTRGVIDFLIRHDN